MCRNPAEIKSEVKEVKGHGCNNATLLCTTSEELTDKVCRFITLSFSNILWLLCTLLLVDNISTAVIS